MKKLSLSLFTLLLLVQTQLSFALPFCTGDEKVCSFSDAQITVKGIANAAFFVGVIIFFVVTAIQLVQQFGENQFQSPAFVASLKKRAILFVSLVAVFLLMSNVRSIFDVFHINPNSLRFYDYVVPK